MCVCVCVQRVQVRAKRFGNTSEDAKKAARAARCVYMSVCRCVTSSMYDCRFGTSLENGYKGLGKHPTSVCFH